jgi:hypothetical protein
MGTAYTVTMWVWIDASDGPHQQILEVNGNLVGRHMLIL